MPEDKDYKDLYLEEKFKGLDAKLDTLIGYQKSNNKETADLAARVKVVETLQLTCPIQSVKEDLKQHKEDTKKEFEELWKDTEDIRYYKNHPKQLRMIMYGFAVMALLYIIPLIPKILSWFKPQ